MVNREQFEEICNRYGLDSKKLIKNNENANYIFPIEKVELALVVQEQNDNEIVEHRRLRKSYIWSKKVRLAIYKVITYLPKLISGNYKRKVEE